MHNHFMVRCTECNVIISQCRCIDPPDAVEWKMCAGCAKKLVERDCVEVKSKTIRVRIAVAVGNLGPWDTQSCTVDIKGDDEARIAAVSKLKADRYMRHEDEDAPLLTHIVEAPLPLPESVTVEGEVSG